MMNGPLPDVKGNVLSHSRRPVNRGGANGSVIPAELAPFLAATDIS
jgi:hypothetical protein